MFFQKVIRSILLSFIPAAFVMISCDLFQPEKQQTDNDPEDETILPETTTTTTNSGRPDGWEYASHDKDAQADYSILFPDNSVNRIDITISDSAWNALLNDMASMAGTFGASGTSGMQGGLPKDSAGIKTPGGDVPPGDFASGQIPQEFYDAAKDKQYGDSCSCTMMGMTMKGTVDTAGGKAFCKPKMNNTDTSGPDINNPDEMGNTDFLPREPTYVPANIEFNGKKWTRVGFRLKGNSSLVSAWGQGVYKLPFRIKTDEFETLYPEIKNQRIYGFQNLSLCNNYMDNSQVHEKIASELFQSNSVPSSKSTFIRLYIDYGNGKKYFGLYTMAEVPDAPFLKKWFSNKNGNLYKPDGTGARFSTFVSSSFIELNNDDNSLSDISALFTALHSDRSNAVYWRTKLESVFNVQLFIKWLAINSAIGNWDAYGSMAHNYYLYNNKGILSWIPWDLGLSFSESGGMGQNPGGSTTSSVATLTHNNTNSNWPLIRYILDDSVYYVKYINELQQFSKKYFSTGEVNLKILAAHDLIVPYVTGTEAEQKGYTFLSTPSDFENAFTNLTQFITRQSAAIASIDGN